MGLLGNTVYPQSERMPHLRIWLYLHLAAAIRGHPNYNALQVNVRRNMTRRLSYGFAFTWDKSMGPGGALLNNNDPAFTRSPVFQDKFRNWGPSYSPTPFYFTVNSVYEVPNLGQKLNFKPLGWITDHWTLSGLYQWRSDTMTTVPNVTFANTNGTCSSTANCYPQWNWTGTLNEGVRYNVVGSTSLSSVGDHLQVNPAGSTLPPARAHPATPGYPLLGTDGNRIINTPAFSIPYPCSQVAQADPHYGVGENLSCFGNAGAGQIVNLPGTRVSNLDMTFSKNFPLKKERRNLVFRAEMYNMPNHTQFSASGINITPSYDWRNWLAGPAGPNQRQPQPLHPDAESAADGDVAAVRVLTETTSGYLKGRLSLKGKPALFLCACCRAQRRGRKLSRTARACGLWGPTRFS